MVVSCYTVHHTACVFKYDIFLNILDVMPARAKACPRPFRVVIGKDVAEIVVVLPPNGTNLIPPTTGRDLDFQVSLMVEYRRNYGPKSCFHRCCLQQLTFSKRYLENLLLKMAVFATNPT